MIRRVAEQLPADVSFDALIDALNALDRVYGDLAAEVAIVDPPQRAFELATELGARLDDAMRAAVGQAAKLRAQMVTRIWKAEELSLAGLANRIGVSKARADQFVRAGQPATPEED
jgi:hypothetical protein